MADAGTHVAFTVRLNTVLRNNLRLNATYYSTEVYKALHILEKSGYPLEKLGNVVKEVFHLPRFKRTFVEDERMGWPYLAPIDLVMVRPIRRRFILRDVKEPERFFVKKGWLLITCSGAVGRVIYVTKRLEEYFITHDIIRVICGSKVLPGYLCAYLSSWIGNVLLTKDEYGMAVRHIEPEHVREIPVPILPSDVQWEIHEMIVRAWEMRDKAIELEDKAVYLVEKKVLKLEEQEHVKPSLSFFITLSDILQRDELRLDVTYHSAEATWATAVLKRCGYPIKRLKELSLRIFNPPPLKRYIVIGEENVGEPYLPPAEVLKLRPTMKRVIAQKIPKVEEWYVREGWILITQSGIPGIPILVTSRLRGVIVSQNMIRVIPKSEIVMPGYLCAYLMSRVGSILLTRGQFGITVRHLRPRQVGQVLVPIPPKDIQREIHGLVVEAWRLREEANRLEDEAVGRLLSELRTTTA